MIERWREAFETNPRQAVADLFGGRAGVGSGLRLDIPELLYQEFPPGAAEREALDGALLHWLHTLRKDYARQVQRLGYAVYGKRVCDALIAVQLLELPRTIHHIRETLNAWLDWLVPLRLAPERDPALECWRVLARRQADTAQAPAWLRLAADPRPEYLGAALAGLQRLPNQGDAGYNQALMLLALLRHAARQSQAKEAANLFNRRLAALRGLYPAGPQHWQEVLDRALNAFEREAKSRTAKELLAALREAPKPKTRKPAASAQTVRPSDKNENERLLQDIRNSRNQDEALAGRLFRLLEQDHRHAEATGDSYFFVHTLSNHGTKLLDRHPLQAETLRRFDSLVERALVWEPLNPYVWMFWATLLARQGRDDLREWVLGETVRLFPGNEPSRVELARLLIQRGEDRWDEAEGWLREVTERSPNHEPSRVELARLLIRRGEERWDEAEGWLREAAERSPNDEPSRVELARLLIQRGEDRWDEAERWLREAAERNPDNEPSRVELARLLIRRGEERWDEAERWLREVVTRNRNNGQAHTVLAKLLARQGKGREAVELLDAFVRRNPQDAIARGLLAKLQAGKPPVFDEAEDSLDYRSHAPRGNAAEDAPRSETPAAGAQAASPGGVFVELERRASLQAEFARAQAAHSPATPLIDQAAAQGEALAGLYWQWLRPGEEGEPPPHAWAWRACRLFQARAEDWSELEQHCPERRMETRFLRLLALPEGGGREEEIRRFRQRLDPDGKPNTLPPLDRFMLDALDRPPSPDSALAVLSSAAIDAPQFATH